MSGYNIPAPTRSTELGTEQQCKTCGDWWPMDRDFFYRQTTGTFRSICKDCCSTLARDRAQKLVGAPKVVHVPEVFAAVRWGAQ